MSQLPSIKGSVMTELVEDVQKAAGDGTIPQSMLEDALRPEDRAVLGQTIHATSWYDIETYRRFSQLLLDTVGNGRREYMRERGFAKGRRLMEAGLYQQLEYATRAGVTQASDSQARFEAYGRDLKLIITVSKSLMNFGEWGVGPDPEHDDRYRIEVSDASAYPEVLGWASEGFIDAMASSHGLDGLWRFRRASADHIFFEMTRSL